ncbi:TetR/AcrR family transcriptional regulator [Burkholderia gladioli]|uniref:TetR/AcrR family transcriptional regulator n=1 Tax=Burkholderia gladioli TaxID=28095 RepID=UPI00163F6DAF|nr:TetR/AcrR family transcriptional regulator [Burkholderia gladioli]URV28336.1 TetR/AcrR family transcriptional regulator [Burkholderia gladioli]
MRVTKEKAAENRDRILSEAARLFLERGVRGVGVEALGEAAGLTYGSLYSQFGSKDQLLAEAVERAFTIFGAKFADVQDVNDYIDRYLSSEHRVNPGDGCVVAAIGPEISRQDSAVRSMFTNALARRIGRLAALMPHGRRRAKEDNALGVIATIAGAMILARAVDDPQLSDRILTSTRGWLKAAVSGP